LDEEGGVGDKSGGRRNKHSIRKEQGVKKKIAVALGKYLIVQLVESESARVIIPETVNQATAGAVWVVRSVGPKCDGGAKVGDQVIISTPSTHEFICEGETYFAVPELGVAVVLR
jgi:hypothetical protein